MAANTRGPLRLRLWLGVVAAAAIAAVIASGAASSGTTLASSIAADVDLKAMILREADLPPGFQIHKREGCVRTALQCGVWTNEQDVAGFPSDYRAMVARSGRMTGYVLSYVRGTEALIGSGVILFRTARGAHEYYAFNVKVQMPRVAGVKRAGAVPLGAEGSLFEGNEAGSFVRGVVWRHGRIVGIVKSFGVSRQQTVGLARVQQRKIVGALR